MRLERLSVRLIEGLGQVNTKKLDNQPLVRLNKSNP